MASARTSGVEAAMRKPLRPEVIRGVRTRTSLVPNPGSPTAGSASPDGPANAVGGHDLEREIEEIERLSFDDLRIRWRHLTGRLAPAHLSRGLLARVLAYRVQAQAYGDLDRTIARTLARWDDPVGRKEPNGQAIPGETNESAEGASTPERPSTPERRVSEPLILKPGTLLTREWQGRMETVMVVADGFAWDGEIFASLSAVAWAMTGTKWNGHRFFGVRPEDRSPRNPRGMGDPSARREGGGKVGVASSGSLPTRPSVSSTIAPRASALMAIEVIP